MISVYRRRPLNGMARVAETDRVSPDNMQQPTPSSHLVFIATILAFLSSVSMWVVHASKSPELRELAGMSHWTVVSMIHAQNGL